MTLQRESRLVRWAYLGDKGGIPNRTSLCAIFWRTVLITPLKLLMVAYAAIAGIGLVFLAIRFFFHFDVWVLVRFILVGLVGVVGVAAVLFAVFGVFAGAEFIGRKARLRDRIRDSVLVQGAVAVKRGFCPIVEIQ